MKKTILTTIFISLFLGVSAQWNNTADSKTTGSLTVGSAKSGSQTNFTILGPSSPTTEASKRDITFNFGSQWNSTIRSFRGGWATGLQFLTTNNYSGNLIKRLNFEEIGQRTIFYDPEYWFGEQKENVTSGEGVKLLLRGTAFGSGPLFISNFLRGLTKQDLRLSIGRSEKDNRLVVGQGGMYDVPFSPLFYVYSNGNVAIGTADNFNPTHKLEVNGTIRAKEVRVETGWADFVFKDDYELPTLQEVKAHINEHKHLPGMPSESEVKENGVGLADATTKLLQKVEELTLYAIQQQELIDKLTQEVDDLKNTQK